MIVSTKITNQDIGIMERLYEYEHIARNGSMEWSIRGHYKKRLEAIKSEIEKMLENL